MRENSANITYVAHIYENLVKHGAGQWVNGAYVAAAAVATNPSLRYLLEQCNAAPDEGRDHWMRLSAEMLEYFSR